MDKCLELYVWRLNNYGDFSRLHMEPTCGQRAELVASIAWSLGTVRGVCGQWYRPARQTTCHILCLRKISDPLFEIESGVFKELSCVGRTPKHPGSSFRVRRKRHTRRIRCLWCWQTGSDSLVTGTRQPAEWNMSQSDSFPSSNILQHIGRKNDTVKPLRPDPGLKHIHWQCLIHFHLWPT